MQHNVPERASVWRHLRRSALVILEPEQKGYRAQGHITCGAFGRSVRGPKLRTVYLDLFPHALDLIRAWGFEYKRLGFYWVKLDAAGYWTRDKPELCLLATRGEPLCEANDVPRLVEEQPREHGRKPDCVRERIERLVAGPYLEPFARETKPGWDCWGYHLAVFARETKSGAECCSNQLELFEPR